MMLHDKIIPGHFLLDYKNDCRSNLLNCPPPPTKLDMYNGYSFHNHHAEQQATNSPNSTEGEVLDLSRRCDSVETRKTPSPYNNSTYSFGTASSPSTHCSSPSNSTTTRPNSSSAPSASLAPHPLPSVVPPPPQGIASLYPMYYANLKHEMLSPPPAPVTTVTSNPLPTFTNNSSTILQQALKKSPKSDDQKCNSPPSASTDSPNLLYPNILNAATTGSIHSGKATRPFNAYPRDPVLVAAHFTASDVLFDKTSMERYSNFRKRALDDLRDTNGGHRIVTNPKMRRTNTRRSQNSECEERAVESSDYDSSTGNGTTGEHRSNDNDDNNHHSSHDSNNENCGNGNVKDEAYYERRRKNNAAAKKSRDRRRIKEDEIAIRAAYLERQNIELLCQIEALKKQLEIFTKV